MCDFYLFEILFLSFGYLKYRYAARTTIMPMIKQDSLYTWKRKLKDVFEFPLLIMASYNYLTLIANFVTITLNCLKGGNMVASLTKNQTIFFTIISFLPTF